MIATPYRPGWDPAKGIAGIGAGLLVFGVAVPELRPAMAALISAGWLLLLLARKRNMALAFAAVLPLAIVLVWPAVLGADAPMGDPACRDPFSVIAVRRLLVAVIGLAVVALVARAMGTSRAELGLRRPTRLEAIVAVAGVLVLAVGGLVIGPAIAEPFFGKLDFPVPLAAIVPAVVFGIANGTLEEVVYRGAMQTWLRPMMGTWVAILLQGLVFGLVHAGPEVVTLLAVHVALLGTVGVLGGIARERLGSLWIPIGVHIGADIALYVGLACRAAAA